MAKIFYSMCGEGRGHAARVRCIVEHLRRDHELVLFAPEQAFEFLIARYPAGEANVEVRRIPGLRFRYTQGRIDLGRTIATGLGYLFKMRETVRALTETIEREQPDLVVTDFEPTLPRAAERCGVPYVSLDHQHFLVNCNLSALPFGLRQWANSMSLAVRMHHWRQRATIISSFFRAPLVSGASSVTLVGPLLRREILQAEPQYGDYVVSYLRSHTPASVLEFLQSCGREVRVYGLGKRESDGRLKFCPFDDERFVQDVAGSAALIGAAGNQTIGEALYLGKPVLALPEAKHHEQRINAHFVETMGAGAAVTVERLRAGHVNDFLARLDQYRAQAAQLCGRIDGTAQALAVLQGYLPSGAARARPEFALSAA